MNAYLFSFAYITIPPDTPSGQEFHTIEHYDGVGHACGRTSAVAWAVLVRQQAERNRLVTAYLNVELLSQEPHAI